VWTDIGSLVFPTKAKQTIGIFPPALHPQQHQRLSEDEQNTSRNLSIFHRMPRAVDHLSAVQDGSSFRLSLCLTPLLENQDKVEICKKHFDVLSLSSSSSSCVLMSSNLISGLS
jgi:hypothetical protein